MKQGNPYFLLIIIVGFVLFSQTDTFQDWRNPPTDTDVDSEDVCVLDPEHCALPGDAEDDINPMTNLVCSNLPVERAYMFSTREKAIEISNQMGLHGAIHEHTESVMILDGYDAGGDPMYSSYPRGFMPGGSMLEFNNWYAVTCGN